MKQIQTLKLCERGFQLSTTLTHEKIEHTSIYNLKTVISSSNCHLVAMNQN